MLYGDLSGYAIKESESLEIQVLVEKYATQHAVGVVALSLIHIYNVLEVIIWQYQQHIQEQASNTTKAGTI